MNIDPQSGKFWFTIAVGIVMLCLALLFLLEPGSSAYYINIFSLIAGLLLLTLVILLVRRSNR